MIIELNYYETLEMLNISLLAYKKGLVAKNKENEGLLEIFDYVIKHDAEMVLTFDYEDTYIEALLK